MVVAARAAERHPEKHLRRGGHDVIELVEAVLRKVSGFIVPRAEPVVAKCDQRLGRDLVHLVTRELFDDELVVALVVVEGANHVIAVAPDVRFGVVTLVSVRVGVANQVEPVPRPSLAVAGPPQQVIDKPVEVFRRGVFQQSRLLVECRRKADQIEIEPAQQGSRLRGARLPPAALFEFCQNKRVDRVADPLGITNRRNPPTPKRLKGPMI